LFRIGFVCERELHLFYTRTPKTWSKPIADQLLGVRYSDCMDKGFVTNNILFLSLLNLFNSTIIQYICSFVKQYTVYLKNISLTRFRRPLYRFKFVCQPWCCVETTLLNLFPTQFFYFYWSIGILYSVKYIPKFFFDGKLCK